MYGDNENLSVRADAFAGSNVAKGMSVFSLEKADKMENPCWDGYEARGTKTKDGKEVPNCVPKKDLKKAEEGNQKIIAEVMQKFNEGKLKDAHGNIVTDKGRAKAIAIAESKDEVEKAESDADKKVAKVMREFKNGTLTSNGKKVTDRKMAIAIALSEAGLNKADYTNDQLKELIAEHERLIDTMESPSKEDDKKEVVDQKKELKNYKEKLSKAFTSLGIEDTIQKADKEEDAKNGDIKPSTREGKKAMVYMDGKFHHFGDSNSKHNYSKEAREAWFARHEDALKGDDSRAKAFRVYAKEYWKEGGKVKD